MDGGGKFYKFTQRGAVFIAYPVQTLQLFSRIDGTNTRYIDGSRLFANYSNKKQDVNSENELPGRT